MKYVDEVFFGKEVVTGVPAIARAWVQIARKRQKAAKPSVKSEPTTDAGKARSEGLRLYKLSGRPKKQDFIHVYGKPGRYRILVKVVDIFGNDTTQAYDVEDR